MGKFIPLILIIGLAVSLAEGYGSSSAANCARLESALASFILDRSQPDTLYSIFEVMMFVSDKQLISLMKSSRYKFATSNKELHNFACKLAQARSRNDVAKLLGVGRSTVDHYYNMFIGPIKAVGGVDHMRDVSQVVGLLMAWSDKTGYPVMPFKHIDDRVTLRTFEAIKKAMVKKYIHDTMINAPFPIKVSPTRALKYLKSAKSYSDFERGVFLDPHQLEDFAGYVKQHKEAISKGSKNVRSTMKFIDALAATGILYLK